MKNGTCLKIMETFSITAMIHRLPLSTLPLSGDDGNDESKREREKKGLDVNLCTVFDAKSFVFL